MRLIKFLFLSILLLVGLACTQTDKTKLRGKEINQEGIIGNWGVYIFWKYATCNACPRLEFIDNKTAKMMSHDNKLLQLYDWSISERNLRISLVSNFEDSYQLFSHSDYKITLEEKEKYSELCLYVNDTIEIVLRK